MIVLAVAVRLGCMPAVGLVRPARHRPPDPSISTPFARARALERSLRASDVRVCVRAWISPHDDETHGGCIAHRARVQVALYNPLYNSRE